MRTRKLGATGPEVSALGLGCMSMTGTYGTRDEKGALATIHRALELGVNFLDTADAYGDSAGENERLVAQAIKGKRDEFVLATKCGFAKREDGSFGIDGRPDYIRAACDRSLERLETDVIDLYYLHRADAKVPIEDSMGAMAELRDAGKIRHIGVSEVSPSTLRRAHEACPLSALQSELSLWSRGADPEVLDTCRELGIAFVAYSPLGRGMLSGAITDVGQLPEDDRLHAHPRFQGENFTRNQDLVRRITELAEDIGCSTAQLALAWVLHKGEHVVPIPGTKRRTYLEENAGALAVELSAADMAKIEAAIPPDAATGSRYPESAMRALGR